MSGEPSELEQLAPALAKLPARVLRQVAATRHVVEQYKAVWRGPGWSDGQRETFELNLRAIAAVWSDHPDYRPEWAA